MKKALLLLASTALLLVGCAKEQLSNGVDGGMTSVTFSARVDGGVATKAAADNDGKGINVNRCIMEIYFQNQLYTRLEAAMSGTPATATFANVPVVAGKEYQILFWADCGGDNNADKYYTTKTDTNNQGLKAVTVNKSNFIEALKTKKNDELDAFFAASNYTVSQQAGGNSFTVKLHRPFAQLNVITTDVAAGKTVMNADLLPEKVSVSYTAGTVFNVADSTVDVSYTYSYEAPVYGNKSDWASIKNRGEYTLSMDYILASKEQGAVDVTFITKNGGQAVMTHNLTNLPYQRNYRTNVKGELLTAGGTWTATIDTIWAQPDIVKVVEVADIKSANEIINQYASSTDNLEVKFVGVPNDSGIPSGDASSEFRAILTSPLKQDANLGIEVMTNTKTLYVGDYKVEYSIAELAEAAQLKAATVNINVPQNSGIEKLVINAPSKTVLVNGKLVESVGTITNIDAITSQNTLIIEKNQQVGTLTMHQGGLEIHGTVGTLVINQTDATNNPVKVRTSENLSQEVFDVIYKAGEDGHDYIDRPAYSEKKNANGTWDIIPSVCKITETGKAYGTVVDAFAVVENGQTIVMLQNDVLTKGQTITLENNEAFTLDLNGKTVSIAETGFDFTANRTNSALRNGVPVRFAIVVNGVGSMTICDNSTGESGRLETKNNSYGTTKTILVDGNAVVNVNSGTIAADYAPFYVVGFTGTTAVPANAPKPTLNVNGGKILGQMVGIGIKGNTATLKVTGGEIIAKEYTGVSTNGTQDWYDGGKFAIEITGGLIKSGEGAAMYLPAEGPTVITGGTIEGADGIVVKGGSLSISGNTIVKATGSFGQAASASSGYTDTGSAIYVEDTYENHAPIVNISGGKFSSKNNKAVEYFTTKADDAADKGKVTLTGGIYSDKPVDAFIAQYFQAVENTDAATKAQYPWAVKVNPPAEAELLITKPGQAAEFTTLAAFRDNVNNSETYQGYTVTVLKDIDLTDGTWVPIGTDLYASSPRYFAGIFNGDNHTIKLKKNNIDGDYGLFMQIWGETEDDYAIVKNLKLDVDLSSKSETKTWIGGLTDCAGGYLRFENIEVTGSITSGRYAGGFVGFTIYEGLATFENCVNKADITVIHPTASSDVYSLVGGLVAQFDYSTLNFINCRNEGKLKADHTSAPSGASYMGHMAAKSNYGSDPLDIIITNCSFSENAEISGWNVSSGEISSYPFEGYIIPTGEYTYGAGTPNRGKQMIGGYFKSCSLDGVVQNWTYPNGNN